VKLHAETLRELIEPLFCENFSRFGELGAAVSIWQNGEPILELHGGFCDRKREQPWNNDTIALVWSATKGIGSACLLHALQENKIKIEQRVSEFWPEFGQNGKMDITLAQLLSHSAGICALDQNAEVTDYPAVIRALEKQRPLWPPGSAHGYHARTFGFLIDELTRRIGGISISKYWRTIFAEPLSLDFWIGLPEQLNSRCATIYPAKAGRLPEAENRPSGSDRLSSSDFYRDLVKPGTLQRKTFTSPYGLNAVSDMNKAENRAREFVSFGGIGSAPALAKFYAMLANGGEIGGRRFFGNDSIKLMTTTVSDGLDRVFKIPTAFSAGFMKDSASVRRKLFSLSTNAFGHPGAGGSHAFADPENRISFAYVMNQMEQSVLPNEKSLRLVDALYL
jgi:CubicO group peptidase (beta-lactamase class C family)